MTKKLVTSLLMATAVLSLVACGNQSQSNTSQSETSTSSEASSISSASSSATSTTQESSSSSHLETIASNTDGTKVIHQTPDGKTLSYTYRLSIAPGNYRQDGMTLMVSEYGTFNFRRPGVASILTYENGTLRLNLEESGSEESLTTYEKGTYAVRTDKVAYTTAEDGSFTFKLEGDGGVEESGKDIKRLYELLKKHNLPTVDDYLKKYEENVQYIYDNFSQ